MTPESPRPLSWLFLDLNSYFASVEQQLDPALRGRPIIVAPVHTPKDTLAQIGGWLKVALQDPDVKAKLALQGLYPVGMCGDEFAAYARQRYDEYGKAISAAGLKPQ